MTHLLVTNDFPPKLGGIQSYLYELWRRLAPDRFAVLTIDHGAARFDGAQDFRIERLAVPMLLPTRKLRDVITALAAEVGASLVVLDPALPLGLIGPRLDLPYALVLHGAEVTVPARIPGLDRLLRQVLVGSELLICAGRYPEREARHVARDEMAATVVIPPGVDITRFRPIDETERRSTRLRFGIDPDALLVVSVSRLVPRKGMDVLIESAALLKKRFPELVVAIGGTGRDASRLASLARRTAAPVRFLGRVPDEQLAPLDGSADVWAMLCRNRWLGLEQEGFGIVFLEAAASGVAVLAGLSGGAGEAVENGKTGIVVDRPADLEVVTESLEAMLTDAGRRRSLALAGRRRAVEDFDYAILAKRLDAALTATERSSAR